ncbi:carbohydrate binding domain-containing protein [Salinispira pacifica]|uniref:Beta-glucanase n=1 Tax=Salinispira pacifica TaxID=1307761 RepID=V5WF64_9SPIO|nr:carbohydrate binding domain-containing protein [Salinispira pacifica]AHC14184.1 Beta-glucanase precursor [Salinispira pacifica]
MNRLHKPDAPRRYRRGIGTGGMAAIAAAGLIILLSAWTSCTNLQTAGTDTDMAELQDQWHLVWEEDFSGDSLDAQVWNYVIGAGGYGNNELQYYSDREKNVRVEKGRLIIQAHDEPFQGSPYTSAKITTQDKADWLYGRFEFRAKLPEGQGIWPAIWMMPTDYELYGQWPSSGEIDIVELVGHEPDTVHGTLHYGLPHTYTGSSYPLPEGKFSDDFHTFALEWEPGIFRWYVDGNLYRTQSEWFSRKEGQPADYTWPAPFDRSFYLQLNLAVGGNWPGYPDETTRFPQQMEVDYIRVYEKPDGYPAARAPDSEGEEEKAPEGRAPTADGNLVYNGSFSDELDYWEFGNFEGGSGSALWDDGEVHIQISRPGNQIWANQLIQQQMNLQKGANYRVSFKARAAEERDIMVKMGGLAPRGWAAYSGERYISIDTEMKEYSFEFTMSEESDVLARYEFNMGLSDADVWIDDARLENLDGAAGDAAQSADAAAGESGNTEALIKPMLPGNELIYNGGFELGTKRTEFWELETDGDSEAELRVNPQVGERALRIFIAWSGDDEESVVLRQKGLDIRPSSSYILSFDARSSKERPVVTGIGSAGDAFSYSGRNEITLTEEWKTFSNPFSTSGQAGGAGIFSLYALPTGVITRDVYLDNVSLEFIPPPVEVGSGITRIEAEDFFGKSPAPRTQPSSEGGLNVGWLEDGDWLSYNLDVQDAGEYLIRYRVATDLTSGSIRPALNGSGMEMLQLEYSGGWQEWTTIEGTLSLDSGEQELRVYASGLNLNWIELEKR